MFGMPQTKRCYSSSALAEAPDLAMLLAINLALGDSCIARVIEAIDIGQNLSVRVHDFVSGV